MKKRTLLGLMAGLPVSGVLTACGGNNSGSAKVRLVNASPGYSALDLYIDDNLKVSNVAYGAASGYVSEDSGSFDTSSRSRASCRPAASIRARPFSGVAAAASPTAPDGL